ncbi:hypothetical protein GQ42DRAFT_18415 [Ramicandelaber brevisporus]|nr:hypothetical protein GQ42DRAFT_18415 [Ramicandelaber brevisporus]
MTDNTGVQVVRIPALLDSKLWHYRGEGNANIVLSYAGMHSNFRPIVLRLRKVMLDKASTPVELDVMYARDVISPLLGSQYVAPVVLLAMNREFLMEIADRIREQRPEKRRHSDIDTDQHAAIVSADLMYPPTYRATDENVKPEMLIQVEIKPKYAVAPGGSGPQPCRSCLMQYYKSNSNIQPKTCMLGLYSDDNTVIQKTVSGLLSNPQKYMSIRVNNEHFDQANSIQQGQLAKYFGVSSNNVEDQLSSVITNCVIQSNIMHKLKAVQHHLLPLGYAGLEAAVNSQCPPPHLQQPSISDYIAAITASTPTESPLTAEQLQVAVNQFLVYHTVKDCSVLLTVSSINNSTESDIASAATVHNELDALWQNSEPFDGKWDYDASARVVDLDIKPISRLQKYFDTERATKIHYANTGATFTCINNT